MIVETALLLGGAIVTAMIGAPVVGRLAGTELWKKHAPRDPSTPRTAVESRKAFEPLDLGPDPMRWPSEVNRPLQGRPEPQWPSQTWDDPHFGVQWKENRPEMSQASDDAWQARKDARRHASENQRAAQRQESVDAEHRKTARVEERQVLREAAARTREHIQSGAQRHQAAVQELGVKAVNAARIQEQRAIDLTFQAVGIDNHVPTVDELERLVASVGLAGTVQEIMNRTGWDFRQAAHHLARTRSSGR